MQGCSCPSRFLLGGGALLFFIIFLVLWFGQAKIGVRFPRGTQLFFCPLGGHVFFRLFLGAVFFVLLWPVKICIAIFRLAICTWFIATVSLRHCAVVPGVLGLGRPETRCFTLSLSLSPYHHLFRFWFLVFGAATFLLRSASPLTEGL